MIFVYNEPFYDVITDMLIDRRLVLIFCFGLIFVNVFRCTYLSITKSYNVGTTYNTQVVYHRHGHVVCIVYSLFQTFRQSTFCDSFYEFFSFFLITVRKLKTSSRRV